MATLLALETSGDACSVALWRDGDVVERHEVTPRSHTQAVLPLVDAILSEANMSLPSLNAIAFGCGPGSFTGLRVCASVVQGLAFAADLPCLPVSSLAALAHTAITQHQIGEGQRILVCVDARMDEVYWCAYRVVDGFPQALGNEQLSSPEAVLLEGDFHRVGSGWQYAERLPVFAEGADIHLLPRATSVAALGAQLWLADGAVPSDRALPRYLRDEVAWR
ncbi:tRNA (adenosine(37)-N6)-threonylcarbamoyltransferase complex dimerization subunit type 1 TsaB [Litorivivens sp.]|uniref:tRNA (adenosine(37)-N6)-threonylcarbamoyltransferase complex dimerization subunit type 1 TsaB n=1 Tax=Litorivivens sp. TaxID=2020868 RepID=UPI003564DB06